MLVSELGVFSRNETVEDLATSSIKFILLPVLLGYFSVKRTDVERLEVLRLANVYFRDFMTRCRQYEFTDIELQKEAERSDGEDDDEDDKAEKKKNCKVSRPGKPGMPTPQVITFVEILIC